MSPRSRGERTRKSSDRNLSGAVRPRSPTGPEARRGSPYPVSPFCRVRCQFQDAEGTGRWRPRHLPGMVTEGNGGTCGLGRKNRDPRKPPFEGIIYCGSVPSAGDPEPFAILGSLPCAELIGSSSFGLYLIEAGISLRSQIVALQSLELIIESGVIHLVILEFPLQFAYSPLICFRRAPFHPYYIFHIRRHGMSAFYGMYAASQVTRTTNGGEGCDIGP